MSETPLEKRFAILCQIVRAQHFAWRSAVVQQCPGVDPAAVAERMWQITGGDTAKAYLKHIDPDEPLASQVAASIAWSSQCMGEDAVTEESEDGREAFVRHNSCPWKNWHERMNLVSEDRPGCDAWFAATIDGINRALGTCLRFETLETLPEGGTSCLRRLWVPESE
jgi:hypothetical protein